jgi:phosphohistidine phosphatase
VLEYGWNAQLVSHVARRLVIVRHAKSDWPEGVADHERPLAPRGRRDAKALGTWLRAAGVVPDLVVVSTAQRARETWELAGDTLGAASRVALDDRVYAASVDELLSVVKGAPSSVGTMVLVGHNPGAEELAMLLDDGRGFDADASRLRTKFPTNGVAILDVPSAWARTGKASCRLVLVATPRASSA